MATDTPDTPEPDKVVVYQVRCTGTKRGDWEYDDSGGYYQSGYSAYSLDGVYATREAAQRECDELNGPQNWAGLDDQYGPFADVTDDGFSYEDRVKIPWPQINDWLRDHEFPLIGHLADADEDGAEPAEPDDPTFEPDTSELQEWWLQQMEPYLSELDDFAQASTLTTLGEAFMGPKLYEVAEMKQSATELSEIVDKALTAGLGDQAGRMVVLRLGQSVGPGLTVWPEQVELPIERAAQVVARFIAAHPEGGTVRFGPPLTRE